MNFNINLPSNRCFKTEEVIVDKKEDCYEALSINDIVYRLNSLDNLEQTIDEMITLFNNSGLDYHINDELDNILMSIHIQQNILLKKIKHMKIKK